MLDLLDKDFKSATTNMLKELIKTMSKELKYENDGSPRILIKRQKLFKRKKKKHFRPGTVAHIYNPNTLGDQGRKVT